MVTSMTSRAIVQQALDLECDYSAAYDRWYDALLVGNDDDALWEIAMSIVHELDNVVKRAASMIGAAYASDSFTTMEEAAESVGLQAFFMRPLLRSFISDELRLRY